MYIHDRRCLAAPHVLDSGGSVSHLLHPGGKWDGAWMGGCCVDQPLSSLPCSPSFSHPSIHPSLPTPYSKVMCVLRKCKCNTLFIVLERRINNACFFFFHSFVGVCMGSVVEDIGTYLGVVVVYFLSSTKNTRLQHYNTVKINR